MRILNLKTKKRKIILFSVLAAAVIVSFVVVGFLLLFARIDYKIADNLIYEVNTEHTVDSLFSQINSGTLENGDETLDTGEVGEKKYIATIVNRFGSKQLIEVPYIVNDTTAPVIDGEEEISFKATEEGDLLSNFRAEDNSKKEVKLLVEGDYDLAVAGDYLIKIIAEDESGNKSDKEVKLKIVEPPRAVSIDGPLYYIEVNRSQNVVIIYSRDRNGNYSNIAKVFVASTGAPDSETPLGTFATADKYETLLLVGNVWGHYAVRINGPYFFHSVPYFTKGSPWDNLEYLEYNKLGSGASAGCVRLAVADAKWIYDNISYGTTVKIYDSDTLPDGVTKPSAIRIDENSINRGWDPTDPDPNNPNLRNK